MTTLTVICGILWLLGGLISWCIFFLHNNPYGLTLLDVTLGVVFFCILGVVPLIIYGIRWANKCYLIKPNRDHSDT